MVQVVSEVTRVNREGGSGDEKKKKKSISVHLVRLSKLLPSLMVASVEWTVRFRAPGWESTLSLTSVLAKLKDEHLLVQVGRFEGKCVGADGRIVEFLTVENFEAIVPLTPSERPCMLNLDSAAARLDIEMFFAILPSIAPLIEVRETGSKNIPCSPATLPFPVNLVVKDRLRLTVSTQAVGSCRAEIFRVSATVSRTMTSFVKSSGCVMTSPTGSEMVRLSPFSMTGSRTLLDFDIPRGTITTGYDGIVFWIRALILCGAKASVTKRPHRVSVRNTRTKAFYDYELCGIDWPDDIASYIPKVVPVRIRLGFSASIEVRTDKGERVVTEDAVIDCNLPAMEIVVMANSIEVFGLSRRRCAYMKKFEGWIPQFSGPILRDVDTGQFGKAADSVACHHVPLSPFGPIPIAICFSDVTVEIAEDLIMLVGSQIFQAVENIRRWDLPLGYVVVPFYKPVTVRLSRVRFAPAELHPAVLDVNDWELGIGPTKDCLSFAFLGVKAWVPSTVTVPPILHVPDPALVDLRVKRLIPLSVVRIQSDYSMQPGCWRDLTLSVPIVHAAVAPGLHATTRFIDGMMKTIHSSIRPGGVTPVASPSGPMRKGPVKNVRVKANGLVVKVVGWAAGSVRGGTDEQLNEKLNCLSFHSHFPKSVSPSSTLLVATLGAISLSLSDFNAAALVEVEFLKVHLPSLADLSVGPLLLRSVDGECYTCELGPVGLQIRDSAMAMFGAYSAMREAIAKAWFIAQMPKLNSVMNHLVEVNTVANALGQESPPQESNGLVNGKLKFSFPFECTWQVPHGTCLRIAIPEFRGESVFHGFAQFNVARRFRSLTTDVLLVQWLRFPWTVFGDLSPRSPSVAAEKASWDLHSEMTTRIAEFLAGHQSLDGPWEYLSARGLIDTPVYMQLLLELVGMEVQVGGRRLLGFDSLEVRGHCHNLPTNSADARTCSVPKLKLSYWMSLAQTPAERGLTLDLIPEVHVPLMLQLVGSPGDLPASEEVIGAASTTSLFRAPISTSSSLSSSKSVIDRILDHVDFGFRLTLAGVSGRAANWVFNCGRVALFKEEENGKGIVVAEVRDFQIAMSDGAGFRQSLHSQVCQSVPHQPPVSDVFPFLSVRQLIMHVGLEPASSLFCNISGARLWWSPSLNRAMRVSLTRTDALVELLSRWKLRFTADLFGRLGKTRRERKTLESIMNFLDWFLPSGGSVRLLLRCADVQVNFHTLHNGMVDDLGGDAGSTPPKSPDSIPKHFHPFGPLFTPPSVQTPTAHPVLLECCACISALTFEERRMFEMRVRKSGLNLEIPKAISWATLASPLPPLPLALFSSPPNSRKERSIGAVSYEDWIAKSSRPGSPTGLVRPKPRGSQLVLSSKEAVFEVLVSRAKAGSGSSIKLTFNAAFKELLGSVAPTALRGLIWLGQPGQTLLRQILTIQKILLVVSCELFPLKSARVRFLIPKVHLSADDDAFHLITDVLRNCVLYRGAIIDAFNNGGLKTPNLRTPGSTNRFSGPIPTAKREAVVDGLLTSLAVADANLPPTTDHLSAEYIIESISVNLTHRQRCFVQLELLAVAGKHSFAIAHPHRPMQFSFQIRDICILAADPTGAKGSRAVLKSASPNGSNLVTMRGNDRYITLNNREWQVYDTLFLSVSPIAVDVTQELIEELYVFLFPPNEGAVSSVAPPPTTTQSLHHPRSGNLDPLEEHVEVVGNKLLSDRNKTKAKRQSKVQSSIDAPPISIPRRDSAPMMHPSSSATTSAAMPIFFKFVRFSNIDSIITFKGKQFSLNNMNLTLKYYLKRRRLATWKEFLDEWGTKVGKQAFGSFVKHGFSRKKGIQDIIVNKLNSSHSADIDKLLFGKYAPK